MGRSDATGSGEHTPCVLGRSRWLTHGHGMPEASRPSAKGQQRPAIRLDNWCAPVIHWCAPVELRPQHNGPSGWHPAEAQCIGLGVAMRLHRIAMPAGQAGSPAAIAAPVAATDDARQGADTGRLQVVRAQHRQGRPPSELFATATRPLDDGAIPPRSDRTGKDRPARWLTAAMLSLAVLAAAAAIVSFAAQYRMVFAAKGVAPVAALEAAIPDVAALVFATLGIALALHGRRAIRARVLNVAAVATSVAMNVLAAGRGWRDLAIWAMPPVAYALASDTAIGVVRAWALARQKDLHEVLDSEE